MIGMVIGKNLCKNLTFIFSSRKEMLRKDMQRRNASKGYIMTNICSLPSIPIVKTMEYLPVADILKLRLVCSYMFVSSQSDAFFKRVKIRINQLSTNDLEVFKNLCDKFVRVSVLQINRFDGDINLILPCIRNVKKIIIHTKQLLQICSECSMINTLAIDVCSLSSEKSVLEEVNFRSLSKLAKLRELSLGVRSGLLQNDVLSTSNLYNILTSAKSISKIKFIGHMNITGPEWTRHLDEKELADEKQVVESLMKVISCSHNIKEWSFSEVYWKGNLFQFPSNISILTWRVPLWFNSACILHTHIEHLRIDGCAFDATNMKLPTLKILQINGDIHNHGNVDKIMDPIDTDGLYLPKLEDLFLCCVKDLFKFEPLLLPTLKRLSLGPIETLKKNPFAWILRILTKCIALSTLIIDRKFYESEDQSLAISESGLKDLLIMFPSLEIKFVGKFQNISISLKNFNKEVRKLRHFLL